MDPRFLGVVAAGLAAAWIAPVHADITGAGATFPYPIYAKWAEAYRKDTGIAMNYQSIGSGGGIAQIKAKTVDFGASDMPLKADELAAAGLMQFPAIIGGIVPVVNLEGVSPGALKLSGAVLADVYLGKIKRWNDNDAGNRIRWANARADAQLGVSTRTDTGAPLTHFVREPALIRYLEGDDFGEAVVVASARMPGVMLSMQLVPFGVDEKLLIARDISEREAVARRHRDFIANVSHELRTPLTVLSGFVETLQDLDLDERQRSRYLGLMQEQTRSMGRLVAVLLTLSSLESDEHAVAETRFAVAPLLESLAADARALSGGAHAIEVAPVDSTEIVGNREEIGSAFANLVSNAIRYTPAQGRVTLAFRVDADGSGVFSVRDTGIGIAPPHIPRLTERFYRVDRSRSRATGGTGLGLAIVKHVLLRHEATLEIASVVGEGSTFAVRLPASRVTAAYQ